MNSSQTYHDEVCRELRLNELIADLLSRLDDGEAIDIVELAHSHPGFSDELKAFFSASSEIQALLGVHSQAATADQPCAEQSLRSTASLDEATVRILQSQPIDHQDDPTQIGKYEIRRRLGCGEFGRVFLAFDPLSQREVAIKVPVRTRSISSDQRSAFLHEARSVASLRHEFIATLYDVHESADGEIYLIYEYVPGTSLQDVLAQRPPSIPDTIGWISSIASALHHAHRQGIVHRDVKPSNIILTEVDGLLSPRIVDFGLALLRNSGMYAGEGKHIGAFRYMSPEQALGDSHWATAQSDVFSLGVILYEMICGQSPWEGSHGREILRDILNRHPTPPRVLNPQVPREVERVCLKALAKSPQDRYTTAEDFARELRSAVAGKSAPRRGQRFAAIAAVLLVIGSAFGWHEVNDRTAHANHKDAAFVDAIVPIPPQEVRLELRIQVLGKPGGYSVLDQDTIDLEPVDAVQIYAELAQPGYLYTLWRRPNGDIEWLGDSEATVPRPALQVPQVGPQLSWPAFGAESVGENLVVAFAKRTPLTAAEAEALTLAARRYSANRLGELTMFELGYPRSVSNLPGPKRGGSAPANPSRAEYDEYLGELGAVLNRHGDFNYQAIVFRVNPTGYRTQGL